MDWDALQAGAYAAVILLLPACGFLAKGWLNERVSGDRRVADADAKTEAAKAAHIADLRLSLAAISRVDAFSEDVEQLLRKPRGR